MSHISLATLEAALESIRQAPASSGTVDMIVRRPAVGIREVLDQGELSVDGGLTGDSWPTRWSGQEADRSRHLQMQVTLMNSRVVNVIAGEDRSRWSLAGDQFFVDLDLSDSNLPAGTKLSLGDAVIEVTAEPHLGCRKFSQYFGRDAVQFVNSSLGKQLNLRGINARVIAPGVITTGSAVGKLSGN